MRRAWLATGGGLLQHALAPCRRLHAASQARPELVQYIGMRMPTG
jgi:hypothetical protein